MELEEMKNAWLALGEKLDQKEKISALLIREMYQTKVKKSLNVLLGYEILSVVVCFLILPFIGWIMTQTPDLLFFYTMLYWGIFSLLTAIWCSVKVTLLLKIDELGIIKDNIKRISTYAVWIHKERMYYTVFGIVGVIPISIIYMLHAGLWQWIFMGAVFIVVILLTIWSYKRLYYKNIRTIQQNLNELKDIED
ncbi:hypothetical protein [Massilibacteroides sp.]|uniref:hypothetical protein n=1 Tax=Massilibacteroides sp. TaxID=2034766 RepID=UPI002618C4EC|nr:hypothetical protein [Massilibacteroides sp.]MDD4514730.1 hypothetical protein [Massilibacteroides sp.]